MMVPAQALLDIMVKNGYALKVGGPGARAGKAGGWAGGLGPQHPPWQGVLYVPAQAALQPATTAS